MFVALPVCTTPFEADTFAVQHGWRAELPDYVLDAEAGAVLQLRLDLKAATETCVSRAACMDFLLRRRSLGGLASESARSELAVSMIRVRLGCGVEVSADDRIQGCRHAQVISHKGLSKCLRGYASTYAGASHLASLRSRC